VKEAGPLRLQGLAEVKLQETQLSLDMVVHACGPATEVRSLRFDISLDNIAMHLKNKHTNEDIIESANSAPSLGQRRAQGSLL
jgi:hypothetical protein